jgi:hypothetical protein
LELSADRGYEWAFWRLARWYEGDQEREADLGQALYYTLIAVEAGESLRHPSGTNSLPRLASARTSCGASCVARGGRSRGDPRTDLAGPEQPIQVRADLSLLGG